MQRWRADRYRREALAALESLRDRVAGGDTTALSELAPLLRATALQVLPRSRAAALSGGAWRDALAALAPELPPLPVEQLHCLAYASPDPTGVDSRALFDLLERWIREHRGDDA